MQRHMQQQVEDAGRAGGFEPVEGVSLEAWAAINASIVSGANHEDLLKGAGIDKAPLGPRVGRVERAHGARHHVRDHDGLRQRVPGRVDRASSATYATEAAAARAANRDLADGAADVVRAVLRRCCIEQAYAAKQGKDPVESLKSSGLTIVDWTDLGTYMGYFFHRDAVAPDQYEAIHKRRRGEVRREVSGREARPRHRVLMCALARWDAFLAQIEHAPRRGDAEASRRARSSRS